MAGEGRDPLRRVVQAGDIQPALRHGVESTLGAPERVSLAGRALARSAGQIAANHLDTHRFPNYPKP